jgi:hypothetical protein
VRAPPCHRLRTAPAQANGTLRSPVAGVVEARVPTDSGPRAPLPRRAGRWQDGSPPAPPRRPLRPGWSRPRPAAPPARRLPESGTAPQGPDLPVRTRGRRFVGAQVMVRRERRRSARLGVSSPKKYGDAVRRNRFRRLVRAAFRAVAHACPRATCSWSRDATSRADPATLCWTSSGRIRTIGRLPSGCSPLQGFVSPFGRLPLHADVLAGRGRGDPCTVLVAPCSRRSGSPASPGTPGYDSVSAAHASPSAVAEREQASAPVLRRPSGAGEREAPFHLPAPIRRRRGEACEADGGGYLHPEPQAQDRH